MVFLHIGLLGSQYDCYLSTSPEDSFVQISGLIVQTMLMRAVLNQKLVLLRLVKLLTEL